MGCLLSKPAVLEDGVFIHSEGQPHSGQHVLLHKPEAKQLGIPATGLVPAGQVAKDKEEGQKQSLREAHEAVIDCSKQLLSNKRTSQEHAMKLGTSIGPDGQADIGSKHQHAVQDTSAHGIVDAAIEGADVQLTMQSYDVLTPCGSATDVQPVQVSSGMHAHSSSGNGAPGSDAPTPFSAALLTSSQSSFRHRDTSGTDNGCISTQAMKCTTHESAPLPAIAPTPSKTHDLPSKGLDKVSGLPRKNLSTACRSSTEASSKELNEHQLQETLSETSLAISDGTSSATDLDSLQQSAAIAAASQAGRRLPDRHASLPVISGSKLAATSGADNSDSTTGTNEISTSTNTSSVLTGAGTIVPERTVSMTHAGNSSPVTSPEALRHTHSNHKQLKANPSRLSLAAGPGRQLSNEGHDRVNSYSMSQIPYVDGRHMHGVRHGHSTDPLGTSHSAGLACLQRTVEQMMLQDGELLHKVHSSMRGISSLAKETTNLEVGRDATGATCINQYVVVKTLGRGSFGKVKLCLNTLDGSLYAIKMVNRSFMVKQLQKPQAKLRKRVPSRAASSGPHASSSTLTNNTSSTGGTLTLSGNELRACTSPGVATPGSPPQTAGSDSSTQPMTFPRRDHAIHALSGGLSSRMSMDDLGASPLDSKYDSDLLQVPARRFESTSTKRAIDTGVMREIAVLKKMDHPNVVKLHEVIDPPGASYMMLVMEYMERGPVLETKTQTGFQSFPERIARDYFRQACAGLDYLHYNNVVHGDLKPENLLVNAAGQLKIGDFGSARMMSDSTANTKVSSTPAFQPPEVLAGPVSCEDPHAADVWALGVCLYCFIFGRLPFVGENLLAISQSIRTEKVVFPIQISADLVDLFGRVLDKDPAQRITLSDVMTHPWVTERGMAPLPSLKTLITPPKLIEVSRNEAQSAIDRSSLVSMIRARLKEKTFTPGEVLFREGDEAHCIYMIMSGVVEITSRLTEADADNMMEEMEEQSFSVDLDESFTLDCNQLSPAGLDIKDGKLHIDRHKAQALKDRMRGLLLGKQAEYVTEVKGPGQVIGDVGLDKSAVARHRHGARARDHVTVVKLTEDSFLKAVMQQAAEQGVEDMELLVRTADGFDMDSSNHPPYGSTGLTTILDTDAGDITGF